MTTAPTPGSPIPCRSVLVATAPTSASRGTPNAFPMAVGVSIRIPIPPIAVPAQPPATCHMRFPDAPEGNAPSSPATRAGPTATATLQTAVRPTRGPTVRTAGPVTTCAAEDRAAPVASASRQTAESTSGGVQTGALGFQPSSRARPQTRSACELRHLENLHRRHGSQPGAGKGDREPEWHVARPEHPDRGALLPGRNRLVHHAPRTAQVGDRIRTPE